MIHDAAFTGFAGLDSGILWRCIGIKQNRNAPCKTVGFFRSRIIFYVGTVYGLIFFLSFLYYLFACQKAPEPPINKKGMHKVSDASGKLRITTVVEGKLDKAKLDSNDVFLVDAGAHLFVWIGKGR